MVTIHTDAFFQSQQANKIQSSTKSLLTVIIPSYNCAQWLERSVRSTQSLSGCEVQVVIVDDGSTDQTQEILQSLKHDIPKLEIFIQPNGGPSSARNLGLGYARGQYVMFLDADDELIPCDLSFLLELLAKPCPIRCCAAQLAILKRFSTVLVSDLASNSGDHDFSPLSAHTAARIRKCMLG